MTTYLAHINVMLRPLVNDPQGLAVKDGLHALGFQHVATVRVGKRVEVHASAGIHADHTAARVLHHVENSVVFHR